MLEIICIIWLWRVNGKHAMERGQRPGKYRALTLGLWFGLEFVGTFIGIELMQVLKPDANPIYGAYLLGVIGAAIGGFSSYWLAKKAPMGDYRPEDQQNPYWNNQSNGWNQNQNGWNQGQNNWNQNQNGWNQTQNNWGQNAYNYQQNPSNAWRQPQPAAGQDTLFAAATIRIVEEEGGYAGGQDAFFLNGRPVCSLRPGSEYTFTTYEKKNVLTIGRPTPEIQDTSSVLKFIAGENGQIEIHACAGKLLPDKFTNYAG